MKKEIKKERQPIFTLYLPPADRRRLLALCKARDRSASYMFREWLHSIVEPFPREKVETP
jgi:hypothetical protein